MSNIKLVISSYLNVHCIDTMSDCYFSGFRCFRFFAIISGVDVRASPRSKKEINNIDDNDEYLSNCINISTRYPKSITLVSTGKGKHSPTTTYTFKVFQFSLCIPYGSKVLLSIDRAILSVAFMFPYDAYIPQCTAPSITRFWLVSFARALCLCFLTVLSFYSGAYG